MWTLASALEKSSAVQAGGASWDERSKLTAPWNREGQAPVAPTPFIWVEGE